MSLQLRSSQLVHDEGGGDLGHLDHQHPDLLHGIPPVSGPNHERQETHRRATLTDELPGAQGRR